MANVTGFLRANETELRVSYGGITVMRINALLIFIENAVVAMCLYSHRKMFSKKEFWLQLVCLTLNDLFVSVVLFLWSFINYDIFNKTYIGCASLGVLVIVSQLGLLYTVLSICVYRFMFLVCTDRFRFGWKTKMTIFQMVGVYVFSISYVITPILAWGKHSMIVNRCSPEILFGNNIQKAFAFLGTGLFIPLIFLNVLYCVTFFLLKMHLRKRHFIEQMTKTSQTRLSQEEKEIEHDIQYKKGKCQCDTQRYCKCDGRSSNKAGSSSSNKTGSSSSSKPLVPIYREPFNEETNVNQDSNLHLKRKHKCAHEVKCSLANYNLLNQEEFGIYVSENPDEIGCVLEQTPRQRVLYKMSPPAKDSVIYRSSVRNSQRQSLCLIGLILLLIDLSTLPCVIYLIAEKMFTLDSDSISGVIRPLLCLMILNNSLLNPWIYAVQSKEFRGALVSNIRKVFCNSECFNILCKDEF